MRKYVQFVLLVQVVTWLSILLDLQILKQVFGFLFLTFIPGYVILKALRIESQKADTVLLSVGLSLTFIMFIGLAMSTLFPLIGLTNPLTLSPLVLVISFVVSSVLLIRCRPDLTSTDPQVSEKAETITIFHVLLFAIPALGVVGAVYDNISILLVMIVMMAVFYVFGYSSRIAPTKYHLLIILVISLALIFHTLLISKYIMGEDIHAEVYSFRETQIRGCWVSPGVGVDTTIARFESVLSITILPTVYSAMLDFGMETIFKILIPLVFALVPLVLYRIYETQTNKTVAFLSVLFFMANTTFFNMNLTLDRQMIAELLMVLSIFLLFEKNIAVGRKRILLIILGAGLIVSHYALAYLYVFLIILCFVVLRKWRFKDVLNASLVLLIFSMTFGWYMYVSNAPLMKISDDINRIKNNFMNDISSPAARSSQVATLVSTPSTVVSIVNRMVFLATIILVVIGVAELVLRRRKSDLDSKYRVMSLTALIIMIICVIIPDVAATFNLDRFYGMTMIFLAPFFVLGGQTIINWTERAMSHLSAKISRLHRLTDNKMLGLQLISILLVASFLFNIGFVEHVTGVYPQSWALDKDQKRTSKDISIRTTYYSDITVEQDVVSTTWLSQHLDDNGIVYSALASGIWYSYGLLPSYRQGSIYDFSGTESGSYASLSYASTVGGLLNNTEMSPALTSSNKIYTDGPSEIYLTAG